jgi:hypothetical protein
MARTSDSLVPLKGISFTWALGHVPHSSFISWLDAENAILEIVARATETVRIGYKIEWADGESHESYLDVTPAKVKGPLHIQAHVRQALAITAGQFRPAVMSRQRQKEFLEDQERAEPGKAARAKRILDGYEIGGVL